MTPRQAVSTIFFVNGVVLATWVPHIPAVKERHGLSDAELGWVLLCMAVGAVVALPLAGGLVARFGSRRMTTTAAAGLSMLMPLPVLSPSAAAAGLSLFVFGVANATLDVSMNAQALVVEQQAGVPIMSSFHALFSLGGLVGAGLAALAMAGGVSGPMHVSFTAVGALSAVAVALRCLVPSPRSGSRAPVFALPGRQVVGLGALAFLALLAEGAMGDWSGVYLHHELRADAATGAVGFAAFSLAMTAGRFAGDRLVGRYGAGAVLRTSSGIAAVGFGAALLVARPLPGILGCGAMGVGIANAIPILFGGAGRVPGTVPATALAGVATTGYLGLLAGPPLIGILAGRVGLSGALTVVAGCCGLIALGARVVPGAEEKGVAA